MGTRSQWPSPIPTTASASSSQSSPARKPVRARVSTTRRSRGSLAARAAVMSRAASRSSRNLGSGSGRGGMSPPMTGLRTGASGQSHSMIRSKNTRSMRSRCRWVFADKRPPPLPGCAASHTLKSSMSSRPISPTAVMSVWVDQPAGKLTERVVGRLDAGWSQKRGCLGQVTAHRGAQAGCLAADLGPFASGSATSSGTVLDRDRDHQLITSWMSSNSATAAWSASISDAARWYSPASQSLVRCK